MRGMSTAAKESQLLTVEEVAASLRLSRPTVYRLIHAQILPAHRVGPGHGSLRVHSGELDEWLHTRRTDPP